MSMHYWNRKTSTEFTGLHTQMQQLYAWLEQKNINSIHCATYPNATAPAIANPSAADFPRPRAAVRATVLRKVFSEIASMNFSTALALRYVKGCFNNFTSFIELSNTFLKKSLNRLACDSFVIMIVHWQNTHKKICYLVHSFAAVH